MSGPVDLRFQKFVDDIFHRICIRFCSGFVDTRWYIVHSGGACRISIYTPLFGTVVLLVYATDNRCKIRFPNKNSRVFTLHMMTR